MKFTPKTASIILILALLGSLSAITTSQRGTLATKQQQTPFLSQETLSLLEKSFNEQLTLDEQAFIENSKFKFVREDENAVLSAIEEEYHIGGENVEVMTSSNKKLINKEIKELIQEDISEEAQETAFKCTDTKNEKEALVCALCGAQEAYTLTAETWFEVGLAHGYKNEFSKLLGYAIKVVPNSQWLAAFSEDHICVVSTTAVTLDIAKVTEYVTDEQFSEYVDENPPVKMNEKTKVFLTAFKYVSLGNLGYMSDFLMKFEVDSKMELSDTASLSFKYGWIRAAKKQVELGGVIRISELIPLPFNMDISEHKDTYIADSQILTDHLALRDILSGVLVNTHDINEFVQNLTIPQRMDKIATFQVQEIQVFVNTETQSIKGIDFILANTPDMGIAPGFDLVQGDATIHIEKNKNGFTPSIRVDGKIVNIENDVILDGYITKDKDGMSAGFLQGDHDIVISTLDKAFRLVDKKFPGLFGDSENLDRLRNITLSDLKVKINTHSFGAFNITSQFADFNGSISSFVTDVEGKVDCRSILDIEDGDLSTVFTVDKKEFAFEKYITPKGIDISYASSDLETDDFPGEFKDFYHGPAHWVNEMDVSFKFAINTCEDSAFCIVANTIVGDEKTVLVKGKYDNEHADLVSKKYGSMQGLPSLSFKNIQFEVDLHNQVNQSKFGLKFENELDLGTGLNFTLDGELVFNNKKAEYTARSNEVWSNVDRLNFLEVHNLQLRGEIKEGEGSISNIRAQGLTVWGKDCFMVVEEDHVYDSKNCIFGEGQILLDLENLETSYIIGVYNNLFPQKIMHVFLKNDNNIEVNPNFKNLTLGKYVELVYTPGQGSSEDENGELDQGESGEDFEQHSSFIQQSSKFQGNGISFKSTSKLFGLNGVSTLLADLNTKTIYGLFSFETVKVANKNFILEQDPESFSNHVAFRINSDTEIDKQVTLTSSASLFGYNASASFVFASDSTQLGASFETKLFGTVNVRGKSDGRMQNFKKAVFSVHGYPQDNGAYFADLVELAFRKWTDETNTLITEIQKQEDSILDLIKLREENLCNDLSCPAVPRCTDEPQYQCLKYEQKEVCANEVEVCGNTEVHCSKNKTTCVHEVETCIQSDVGNGECVQKKTECKAYVTSCTEYEYECNEEDEKIKTCLEFKTIDSSKCLRWGWECPLTYEENPECKQECADRVDDLDNIKETYKGLREKFDDVKDKLEGLKNFFKDFSNNKQFKITDVGFKLETSKQFTSKTVSWNIDYSLMDKDESVSVQELNVHNSEASLKLIIDAMGKKIADEYKFNFENLQKLKDIVEKAFNGSPENANEMLLEIETIASRA